MQYIANMQYMDAELLTAGKEIWDDGTIVEIVIWRVPEPLTPCAHHFKYRLYCGKDGACLVRYDNERGKGDHRHISGREESYRFTSPEKLLADFEQDVRQLTENKS